MSNRPAGIDLPTVKPARKQAAHVGETVLVQDGSPAAVEFSEEVPLVVGAEAVIDAGPECVKTDEVLAARFPKIAPLLLLCCCARIFWRCSPVNAGQLPCLSTHK